jgi:polyisoprenyl-teichoic acid--peptidoglycan teichoic acid transferase
MGRLERKKNKRSSLKKKIFLTLMTIFGLLVLGIGGFAFYLYHSASNTVKEAYEPIKTTDKREEKVDLEKKHPISILLLGVDERQNDKGRSDTLIVITLNPSTESMYMFNIPRDTRTKIVGKGIKDKINHAYAFGGIEMAVKTVENFLDIPIDYYIKVNMEALSEIVDTLGGITVNNSLQWVDQGYYKRGFVYKKGEIHLNGPQTLGYVRMRYQDPRGDFGRNERQRQVIKAIIDKGAKPSTLLKLNGLFEVLGDNIKTNLTFDEMKIIQKNYQNARKNMQTLEIKGKGTQINGVYYYIVSDEERLNISKKIKEHLEIK